MNYVNCNKEDLEKEYAALVAEYEEVKGKGLKLNMARGKPGEDQLNLSRPLLDVINSSTDCITAHGADCRNYGELAGIDECKNFFAEIFDVDPSDVMVGGNSSLNMMFDTIAGFMTKPVVEGCKPWYEVKNRKFLCPALPEVREFIKEKIKAYCEVEGLNGIAIDYHRFVDVVLPTTLWPRYGIVQDREYAAWDYGYHPEMLKKFKEQHGYDPREQEDPSLDVKWRQFRCDQITEVANMIAEVVHSYGKTMAASPFPTPKMSSRMVRQDWGKWNLDIVFPMVYHTFYTGDASFISDCTVENARDKNDMTTLYCGMTATDGPMMFECMDAALNNGAQGIAVFTMLGLRSPEVKKQFKAYTDSVRAVRAANGGVIKATYPKVAEPDPFKHEGIMKLMQERMQQIIATAAGKEEPAPLALGEYKEVDSYDATRCYQVVDNNSKTTFDVTFYLYGDVVSGWDVTVADKDSSKK